MGTTEGGEGDMSTAETFGELLHDLRIAAELTLRRFSTEAGVDPGNVSRWERGQLPPPGHSATLERMAESLGLQRASTEWQDFMDRAAADAGKLPEDLRNDAAVMAKMPVLFRSLRGNGPTEEQLRELFEKLKES
jgi:transcriptional regulator with XRE-family HTH domain